MAGPAHGLHMYESEGEGLGRCMYVLMGGRSGGHQAAVLASVKILPNLYLRQHLIYKFSRLFIQSSHLSQLVAYAFFFPPLFSYNLFTINAHCTLQMDRTVKIWVIRATSGVGIRREDKPLFSSGRIHKARVLSVTW